jgi:hypothetical protein
MLHPVGCGHAPESSEKACFTCATANTSSLSSLSDMLSIEPGKRCAREACAIAFPRLAAARRVHLLRFFSLSSNDCVFAASALRTFFIVAYAYTPPSVPTPNTISIVISPRPRAIPPAAVLLYHALRDVRTVSVQCKRH